MNYFLTYFPSSVLHIYKIYQTICRNIFEQEFHILNLKTKVFYRNFSNSIERE